MDITPNYKRRIRIEGKQDDTRGYMLTVHDAQTGEEITNVKAVTLRLHVETVNVAEVVYYNNYEQGRRLIDPRSHLIEGFATLDNPEVAVTAYERLPEEREEHEPL